MSLVLRRSEPLCSLSPSLPEPSPSALSPRTAPSAGPADPRPPGPSRRPGPPQPAAPGPARGARRTPTPGASPSPVVRLELFFHPRRMRQTWAPGSAFPCPPRPPAKAGGASVPHNARWVTDVQRLAGNRRCSTETNQYAERSPGRRRWAERSPAGATPPGRAAPARCVSTEVTMTGMTRDGNSLSFAHEERGAEAARSRRLLVPTLWGPARASRPRGFRATGAQSRRTPGSPGAPERGPRASKAPLTLWELLRLNFGVSHRA